MNGIKKQFILNDQTFDLRKPTIDESFEVIQRIGKGEIASLLVTASEDSADFKSALKEATNDQLAILWNEWLEFMGYRTFIEKFLVPIQEQEVKRQVLILKVMKEQKLISETFLENLIMIEQMVPSNSSINL